MVRYEYMSDEVSSLNLSLVNINPRTWAAVFCFSGGGGGGGGEGPRKTLGPAWLWDGGGWASAQDCLNPKP